MAWWAIRKASQEDIDTLNTKALEFADRHNIWIYDETNAVSELETHLNETKGVPGVDTKAYERRLWRAIIHRLFDDPHAEGIAHGTIGYYVK